MSLPEWFKTTGIPESCVEDKSSCEENKRRFSITPKPLDQIWRVKLDGCWIKQNEKKVDYLFWVKSKSGKKAIVPVELKGGDYGKALMQIDSTLQLLCKHSYKNILHTGQYQNSPGHNLVNNNGVQAYVVLSQGHGASKRASKRGRKIPQHHSKLERIRQKYQVRVKPTTKRFHTKGIDSLF